MKKGILGRKVGMTQVFTKKKMQVVQVLDTQKKLIQHLSAS